jgi:shikimate dehydrogenase
VLNAAVLGCPIGHSLSPTLHRAAYRALGLDDWRYSAHEVGEEELAEFVGGLDDTWRGLSLTMPLKEAAFTVAAEVSETAARTGAVNTLVRQEGRAWAGDNTDVAGLVAALADVEHGGSATVLGSGATARSAVVALSRLGVRRVRVAARSVERAAAAGAVAGDTVTVEAVPLSQWAQGGDRLVVSTLAPAASEAAAGASGSQGSGVLLDVVYADWPTPLARAAAAAGMSVLSGLDMLVHQAAEQVRLMTGRQAPVSAMFAAGREALGG